MLPPGWFICWVLLTLHTTACGLEISGYESDEVICSQGLSDCTMEDEIPIQLSNAVDVQNLTAYALLCSRTNEPCKLCLVIDTELHIPSHNDMDDEGHSGRDEEDNSEETRSPTASVTVCYKTAPNLPLCKKVEFTINYTALIQQNLAKMSMVITKLYGVSFGSTVIVYMSEDLTQVSVPSLDEVCSQEPKKCVEECAAPTLTPVINKDMNHVELTFDGMNDSVRSVCVLYEENGRCQSWNKMHIPLYSVTHCMCLMVWHSQKSMRFLSCPFKDTDLYHRNVWQNLSVTAVRGQMNSNGMMLLWNLSAPCRLEGEVWPCQQKDHREIKGYRQQLANGTWKQNSKGLWEKRGVFEDISPQFSPCLMVKVKGMEHELGPFCLENTARWRWSLLFVGVMLVAFLTVLIFYLLHDYVKKWVWSWQHGGFVKIGKKGHVVLLSPPDMDDGVSESVCRLGSLLRNQGFGVSVDQWSRREQCTLGPLPWLHSQLLELNSQGNRLVVVLTRKALEKTEEWAHQHNEGIKTKGENEGLPQTWSPYSDVFTALLCLIQADKQMGRAGERFLLVKFDSHPCGDRNLPELLQGLPLFQLPSHTQALLTELSVDRTRRRSGGKKWTSVWKWGGSDGWRAKTKEGPDQQKASVCKYFGVEKDVETKPLKHKV